MEGLRLSVGPEVSSTCAIASELLGLNAIEGPHGREGGAKAAAALRAGLIDAVFLIASAESGLVRDLLQAEGIEPFLFRRAAAGARTHRFLSPVTLPEGMTDYVRNIPDRDIEWVAPTVSLVIREGLHSALVDLLVQSAESIDGRSGVFEEPGAFPTPDFFDRELNLEASRFYKYGPPCLQCYLPFWSATLLVRAGTLRTAAPLEFVHRHLEARVSQEPQPGASGTSEGSSAAGS